MGFPHPTEPPQQQTCVACDVPTAAPRCLLTAGAPRRKRRRTGRGAAAADEDEDSELPSAAYHSGQSLQVRLPAHRQAGWGR